jgi:hypothetical protein
MVTHKGASHRECFGGPLMKASPQTLSAASIPKNTKRPSLNVHEFPFLEFPPPSQSLQRKSIAFDADG